MPVTPDGLVALLADVVAAVDVGHPVRVAIDGAPPTDPGRLADALVGPLRLRGRPVARVSAASFARPASVRLERGRTDPDALYELALDTGALVREVLAPLGPAGDGRYLPSLWDVERDRATRAAYATADPTTVLLVDGSLLLRQPVVDALDLAVHLELSAGALARRTPEAERWTLPAHARYADEDRPSATADVVVRADDPRHPAVLVTDRRQRRRAAARGTGPASTSR